MWALWPEVLGALRPAHETGEPLPPPAVDGDRRGRSCGARASATLEYLAATLLDQAWHRLGAGRPAVGDPMAFEQRRCAGGRRGARRSCRPRYRTTYFQHIFAGGYAPGYYSYIWSEVLDADPVEWFKENGGLRGERRAVPPAAARRGGSRDAMEMFAAVRGRGPRIEPLLERRGLTPGYTSQDAGGATVDGDGGAGQV